MANPSVLFVDTKLYSPAEPEGRVFRTGEPWPGDAWSSNPGGEAVGKGATKAAMKDLEDAQARIDAMAGQMTSKDADLARLAGERDAAIGKLHDLEQRAIAAEQGQEAADGRAHDYMVERDQARADFQRVSDQVRDANARLAEIEPEAEKVGSLTSQLSTANQTIADLNDKVAGGAATDATDAPAKRTRGPNKPKPDAATPDAPPEA